MQLENDIILKHRRGHMQDPFLGFLGSADEGVVLTGSSSRPNYAGVANISVFQQLVLASSETPADEEKVVSTGRRKNTILMVLCIVLFKTFPPRLFSVIFSLWLFFC